MLLVINFQLIDREIPEVDRLLLNEDQRYLFDLSQAINWLKYSKIIISVSSPENNQ